MAQQISMEEAFPTFQKRCTELFEENMVLRARVDVLERKLAEAQQAPAGGPDLPSAGPDLAALPDEDR